MLTGHGDDANAYAGVEVDFASCVAHHDLSPLLAFLRERMEGIGRYPQADAAKAEEALAKHLGIRPAEVMLTNGATEAIYLMARVFSAYSLHISQPTFSEYKDAWAAYPQGGKGVGRVCLLCNPNNPTGQVVDERRVVAERADEEIVVIDHSYEAFTTKRLLSPAEGVGIPRLLLIHSMTKRFGVPGLRIGYITGPEELVSRLREGRMPWAVNALAQEAVPWLLAHEQLFPIDASAIAGERKRVIEGLRKIGGIDVYPSNCHILLCRLQQGRASDLKQWLIAQHGLLIRDASNFEGLDEGHFRIALQRPCENDRLIDALGEYLSEE